MDKLKNYLKDLFDEKIYGCPLCNPKNHKCSERDYFVRSWGNPKETNYNFMTEIRALKFGRILQCTVCNRNWYEDGYSYKALYNLSESQLEIILKWNASKNSWLENKALLNSEVIQLYHRFGIKENLPCSATMKSGKKYPFALICQSKEPIFRFLKPGMLIFYLDEVFELEISKYSLSPEIIEIQQNATEAAMGFAPVTLIGQDDKEYTIKAMTYFFNENGQFGQKMKYSGIDYFRNSPNICECDYDDIVKISVSF